MSSVMSCKLRAQSQLLVSSPVIDNGLETTGWRCNAATTHASSGRGDSTRLNVHSCPDVGPPSLHMTASALVLRLDP